MPVLERPVDGALVAWRHSWRRRGDKNWCREEHETTAGGRGRIFTSSLWLQAQFHHMARIRMAHRLVSRDKKMPVHRQDSVNEMADVNRPRGLRN